MEGRMTDERQYKSGSGEDNGLWKVSEKCWPSCSIQSRSRGVRYR